MPRADLDFPEVRNGYNGLPSAVTMRWDALAYEAAGMQGDGYDDGLDIDAAMDRAEACR